MKSTKAIFGIFISFFFLNQAINAQSTWQKLTNFNDANAAVWMSAGATLNYAITADRWIYYSDNQSDVWTPFVNVPAFYGVGSIKASKVSNRIFCLTSSSGIIYTDNFGASWQSNNLNGGGGNSGFGPLLLAYGLNDFTVLVSTIGPASGEIQNNLFISIDNGNNFSALPTLNFYPTGFHFLNDNEVLSNTSDGIFKSTNLNNGVWTSIGFAGLEVTDLAVDGSTVFASVKDSGNGKVYKSIDSGQTWNELIGIPTNAAVSKIAYDSVNQRLLATTNSGILAFANNVWSIISNVNKAHEIIVTGNQSALFSGIRVNGIHKVNADNLSVTPINNGLLMPTDLMAVSADNQLYSASTSTSFLSKLNLNNLTWSSQTLMENLDFTRTIAMGTANDGQCVIGGMHFIAKTANEGNSLSVIADDTTAPLAPVYNILFPQKMFLGNNGSISMVQHAVQDNVNYSPNMGSSWNILFQNVSGQFPSFLSFNKICSGFQNHYILGTSMQTAQNIIAFSSNEGSSWTQLPSLPSSIRDIFMDRFDKLYAVTNTALYSWNTTDQTWNQHNINLGTTSSNKVVEVKFDYNNKIYVLVRTTTIPFSEEGFYISNAAETAFTQVPFTSVGGQVLSFKNLSFSVNNIPIAMSNLVNRDFVQEGIYYFGKDNFLDINTVPEIEKIVVYPNPANDIVTVSTFANQSISGELVNMMGQVSPINIVDGNFNVSTFSNGFYILRLAVDGQSINVKLIIKH